MKYKNRKKNKTVLCLYFNNNLFTLLDFFEMKYTLSIHLSLKRNTLFKKSTLNILLSMHINT